jgi:AcrR family transcriptional regulator
VASSAASRPANGKAEPLSRDSLTEAAVAIARSEGLSAVTMRRLGLATGKAPMTLYSHVPNKEALLLLVADAILGEVPVPQGRWDHALRELSMSTWQKLGEAPGLATFVWRHVPYVFTPHGLRLADGSMGLLIQGGFEPVDASRALESLMTYVTGDVQRHEARSSASRPPAVRLVKGYPNLEAVSAAMRAGGNPATNAGEAFSYGLELLLDGLRRDLLRRKRATIAQRPS